MNTIEILVTCLALSLDCFVVMMARGAMMNPQEHRRSLINSLIFAGSSLLMIVLGSLAGSLIKSQLVLHVNQVIAALILFALGCFLLIQAFRQKAIEERHDDSFNYKKVLILGLITSVDVFLLGTSVTLLQADAFQVCLISTLVTLACVELGQQIGYRLGLAYRRTIFTAGSVILFLISLKVLFQVLTHLR